MNKYLQEKRIDPAPGVKWWVFSKIACCSIVIWLPLCVGQSLRANIFGAIIFGFLVLACCCLSCQIDNGLYQIGPNTAVNLLFCGRYKGTIKANGLWWVNPCYDKRTVSMKIHNTTSAMRHVNDKLGNPIELQTICVWRIEDAFKASQNVESYDSFVHTQLDAVTRLLAEAFPYDVFDDHDQESMTLRSGGRHIESWLERELQARMTMAGIKVIEGKINHVAFEHRMAKLMLKKQEAQAVVSARQAIVEGAVSMVQQALARLERKGTLKLSDEKKALMVKNQLVVLICDHPAAPAVPLSSR